MHTPLRPARKSRRPHHNPKVRNWIKIEEVRSGEFPSDPIVLVYQPSTPVIGTKNGLLRITDQNGTFLTTITTPVGGDFYQIELTLPRDLAMPATFELADPTCASFGNNDQWIFPQSGTILEYA